MQEDWIDLCLMDDRNQPVEVDPPGHVRAVAIIYIVFMLMVLALFIFDAGPVWLRLLLGAVWLALGLAVIVMDRAEQVRPSLRALRCPSCRYSLRGLTPEADGCTVCPECGAAWRMEETKGQRGTGTEGTSTGT